MSSSLYTSPPPLVAAAGTQYQPPFYPETQLPPPVARYAAAPESDSWGGLAAAGKDMAKAPPPPRREAAAAAADGMTSNGHVDSHNFKDHFDKDTLAYVMEDIRLSTLQKKLAKESNSGVSFALACQISESIIYPDNRMYVRRSTDIICDAIVDIFYGKHTEAVKKESAHGLGKLGFVVAEQQEFTKFYQWLWDGYRKAKKEKVQVLFLKSLSAFLALKPNLSDQEINQVMSDIQDALEKTESSHFLMVLVESLADISKWKPRLFEPNFQNVVDILVGWHIDSSQTPTVRSYMSSVLLSWHSYWIIDMEFSSSLLRQFMEDMEAFSDDIHASDDEKELRDYSERVLSLTQVFNTVLSCLKSRQNAVSFLPPESSSWCGTILNCLLIILEKRFNEDVMVAGQHAFIMLMERIDSVFSDHKERLMDYVNRNVSSFHRLSFAGKSLVMKFLTKVYLLLDAANQPAITKIILSPKSPLMEATFSMDKRVTEGAMDVFRVLLHSKSIIILQEVYGYLTSLYEEALFQLAQIPRFTSSNVFAGFPFRQHERQSAFFFVLGSLTNIAAAKGSVLSMWALDPSLFSLLIRHSGIRHARLIADFPWIHHAIVKLCYSHCSRHNFFANSSILINASSQTSSPTSHYFEQILTTVSKLLLHPSVNGATHRLTLKWSREILQELRVKHHDQTPEGQAVYLKLVTALQTLAVKSTKREILVETLKIFDDIISGFIFAAATADPPGDVLERMSDICHYHLRSSCPEIQSASTELLRKLPPLLSEWNRDRCAGKTSLKAVKLSIIQLGSNVIRSSEFKVFVEAILKGPASSSTLERSVTASLEKNLPRDSSRSSSSVQQFLQMILHQDLIALWMGNSVSEFCISNKLKTPLGKAQDTLTTIEKTLRSHLQSIRDGSDKIELQQCHNFLVFFECLEKALCNAYDGSAITLAAPTKNVAAFFSANKKTCVEWITRLRVAVIQFAFLTGDFAYVVRNAYDILPKLTAGKEQQQQTSDDQFLQTVAYLASSLVRLKSPEGLTGLYLWCKERAGRNLPWIRCLVELARSCAENGIQQLTANLESSNVVVGLASEVRQVISNELFLGHAAVGEYAQYEEWMTRCREEMCSRVSPSKNDYLKALSEFNEGAIPLAWKDYTFDALGFNSDSLLFSTHLLLFQTIACFQNGYNKLPSWADTEKLTKGLEKAKLSIQSLMKDHMLRDESRQQTLILSLVQKELANLFQNKPGNLEVLLSFKNKCHSSKILILIKKWGDFFTKYRQTTPQLHFQLSSLDLEIAKRARKESNFRLANRYLQKSLFPGSLIAPTADLLAFLDNMDFVRMPLSVDKTSCLRQCAKLSFQCGGGGGGGGRREKAIATVCGIASSIGAVAFHEQSANSDLLEVSSRALHNMANWLRNDPKLLDDVYPDMMTPTPTISSIMEFEQNMTGALDFLPSVESASDSDMVIGKLLRLSVLQSPQLAKLWNSLAEWSLGIGEQVLADCEKNSITLTEEERQDVFKTLPNANMSQLDQVFHLLQNSRLEYSEKAEIEASNVEYMRSALLECDALAGASEKVVQTLRDIWLAIKKRTFFYHETAVFAFFQYIGLSSGENEEKLIAATLRLLQLTVKHALELQEGLQNGLESTNCSKWKAIIPQLFSRLNHPVRIVRTRISDLLCRLAKDYPHLIIFPAVVGGSAVSTTNISKLLTTINDEEEDAEAESSDFEGEREDESKDAADPYMRNAYAQIVESMKRQNVQSVEQVQRFVYELQRISLLWDELWLGTLQQYNQDISKRVKKMEEEVQRLSDNKTLTQEEKKLLVLDKYNIIFKPLLYVLDKVQAVTSKSAETPHEKTFIGKYGDFIKSMMAKLHNPANPAKPSETWGMLGQLQNSLGNKSVMKTSLRFDDISPSLHAMTKAHIPMPGVTSKSGLTVESIDNNLTILLTKTKPKRVAFYGSDGKKYSYLFKGLEDLHLDERIMQFLTIANIMMKKQGSEFKARHYAVIPFGPRSGLIQWVEGALPMFSLFKKWQLRQQLPLNEKTAAEKKGIAFQKPSDLFYNKIFPLLRDNGITNLDSRKTWPPALMRQAMQELVGETPDSILRQEIWFASVDSDDWYALVRNLTVSFAVMSVIGYIIGLGDRHMDNLLLDLNEGEIIHIDYNVCFEKGKHLRIPERVPCRLTQNIVALFGLSGTEGLFRNSCEVTLSALRQGRETLMTLLEAFVYDPLVDWTPGVELGIAGAYHGGRQNDLGVDKQDRRDMQTEITFSMFAVRVAEMKGPWGDNQKEMARVASDLEDRLGAWLDLKGAADGLQDYLSQQHHSMSVLKEAEANCNHRLYSLLDRYIEHNLIENAVQVSRANISSFVEENERWIHLHQRALASLSTNQMSKWTVEITTTSTNTCSTSSLIKEFLEKAGQSQLLEQFEAVENSFCIGIEKLKQNLLACIQLLGHYYNLSALYPASYKQQHRNVLYVRWAKELSENFSVGKCHEIMTEFSREFLDESEEKRLKQHHVLNLNYQMENWTQEINFRLQNIFQRMINEKIENSAAVMSDLTSAKLELHHYLAKESNEVRTLLGDLVVGVLAELGRKFLSLESVSFDTAESFIDMTSSDGEWFLLDQIHMQIGSIVQIFDTMDFLGIFPASSVAGKSFYKLQNVVKQLNHFNSSFFGIILHEGLKCFQKEDSSAINLAFKLAEIINEAGLPLEELVEELDVEIRYAVSGVPSTNEAAINVAKSLRSKYFELMQGISTCQERDSLSSGQMLVLAFDSLFNSVDAALTDLKDAMLTIDLPDEWDGIDVIEESRRILTKTLNPDLFELLELTTFISRLLVIKEYFSMCTRSMICFKADSSTFGQMLPTGDEIARPVKLFLSEYYRRQMVGLGSFSLSVYICCYVSQMEPVLLTNLPDRSSASRLSLEELTKAFLDKRLALPGKDRTHFLTLELGNISALIKKVEVAKYLEQNIEALHSSQHINQLQRNSFQWFHEAFLPLDAITLVPPVRPNFMNELRNYTSIMLLVHEEVGALQAKYHELHLTVEQRLKWACGANPEMQAVFDNYSTSFLGEIEALKVLAGIMKAVSSNANTVLHHEAMRTRNREAMGADATLMALLGGCQQSASLQESQVHTLTEQELSLFTINPPDDVIDADWIRSTERVISDRVKRVQEKLQAEQRKAREIVKELHAVGKHLRQAVTEHQKLMSDVGALLRTISKSEDYEIPEVQRYLLLYKDFSDVVTTILRNISLDEQKAEGIRELAVLVERLKEILTPIYESVVEFSHTLKEDNLENFKIKKQDDGEETSSSSAAAAAAGKRAHKDENTSEEKNAFALNVLRRIRHKLDGREPDALKRATVPEQVDFLIREATSLDNLSLMYEGWTAWI